MSKYRLDLHKIPIQYETFMKTYHYDSRDLFLVKEAFQELMDCIQAVMYVEMISHVRGKQCQAAVILTLGKAVDELQEGYLKTEQLGKAYLLDCLSMERLNAAYVLMEKQLHFNTGLWCGSLEFLEEEQLKSSLQELFILTQPENVTYNEAYELSPSKSVVLIAHLQPEQGQACRNVCSSCSNRHCTERRI